MSGQILTHTAVLASGASASVVLVPASASGAEVEAALRLPPPHAVIVLNGGTEEAASGSDARLRTLLRDGLAPVVVDRQLTVVTGGTDAGVFRLFGDTLDGHATAPCIGVAPAGTVDTTAAAAAADGGRVALEPHHTHFVLVEGSTWGDETGVMLALVDAISANARSLVVLAGGGDVSTAEVLGHVRAGREVVVLAGSGRLADRIADVVSGRATADDADLAEIAGGRITVLEPHAPPSALARLVRDRLGLAQPTRRRLRSVALFSQLPRLQWRPGPSQPLVSESTLARCPDLHDDVELLQRELMPEFHALDQESLQTQNAFRLGQLALIAGGAIAAALGAAQAAVGGGVITLAVLEAVVAGALAGLTVYIRGRNAQREFFTSRLRAERLRAEYFLVLARAGEYANVADGEVPDVLRRRLQAIETSAEQA
jgi:hypothetical protein